MTNPLLQKYDELYGKKEEPKPQKTHTEKKRKLGAGQEEVIRVLSDQFNETNQKGLRLEDEPMEGVEGVSTGENG